jgi:signal transduction histidine kinase
MVSGNRGSRRRFVVGVELLTGLAIGASAAAAAVTMIISVLVVVDLSTESRSMTMAAAQIAVDGLPPGREMEHFERAVTPLLVSGMISSAVLIDSTDSAVDSIAARRPGRQEDGDAGNWIEAGSPEGRYGIRVAAVDPPVSAVQKGLLSGLAALVACLAILAVFTPRYLRRTVLDPLRRILVEADRFRSGDGSTAEAAGASFHRLIELLHEREGQLEDLRKDAEQRAELVEKRSAAMLSVLGSAVLALDGEGRLTQFNPVAGALFLLGGEDLGTDFPWARSTTGRSLKPVLMRMGESGERVAEFQAPSGEPQGRMYGVSESRSPAGETVVLVTDVTRIGELERKIAEKDSMADIGAASGGISHEMGNTLCALSGYVDLLARGHSDERTRKILEDVRKEVASARELIASFASLASSPDPVASRLPDAEVIRMCSEACQLDPSRCSVSSNGPRFTVLADRKLLETCVRNLVRNALEADPSLKVEVSVSSSGGVMSIEVADTGPGLSLDPEEVFRPFRTTKDRSGGNMGLGLPVSRRIIRAMGGELRAQNIESGGALFTIVLPLDRSGGAGG